MTTTATRETLVGVGEHICAVLRLGDDYTNEEYISEITAARAAGVGRAYADRVLGVDVDEVIRDVEQDDSDSIVRAAESSLRSRGLDPRKATYEEYRDALVGAVS
jgi:hypothetical protein